jgi:hypothetical protein
MALDNARITAWTILKPGTNFLEQSRHGVPIRQFDQRQPPSVLVTFLGERNEFFDKGSDLFRLLDGRDYSPVLEERLGQIAFQCQAVGCITAELSAGFQMSHGKTRIS